MTVLLSSGRRARRTALPLLVCAGLATLLAACGGDPDEGTNGVGTLSAAQIEREAQTAVDDAEAVRLSGALVSQGQTYKLDMLLKESGGSGSVTSKESTFELLRVKDALFLKADADFWNTVHGGSGNGGKGGRAGGTDSEAADELNDKYVKVPPDDPSYEQLRGFTDMKVLLDGLLSLQGRLSKGPRDRIGGVRTVKVSGGEGAGGSLDVSLEGIPYPVQLVRAGGAGTLTLEDWGKDFPLEAPDKTQTVDYGSRLPRSSD